MQPMLAYLTQDLFLLRAEGHRRVQNTASVALDPVSHLPAENFKSYRRERIQRKFYSNKLVK